MRGEEISLAPEPVRQAAPVEAGRTGPDGAAPGATAAASLDPEPRRALQRFAFWAVAITAVFAWPLWNLATFSMRSSLFSHVLLIPLVSAYLVWQRRRDVALPPVAAGSAWAAVPAVLAAGLLLWYWFGLRVRGPLPPGDFLSLMTTAYLGFVLSAALACLGPGLVKAFRFPVLFLAFMIPWPTVMVDAVETALQYGSAEAAHVLLVLSGLPVLRDGLVFRLPGITLEVAQECSGIRSSLVLLITSVLAAHLLLRTRWRRWALVLAVIPLGLARNGFRILTISLLCVHVDTAMIDSPIHHRGGPIFFVLSLIPFFLFLLWLRRTESKRLKTPAAVLPPPP
jgi:exosortase C (VPDSG-CTERM-specific)